MGKVRNVRVWYLRPQDGRREEVAGFWQHGSTSISTFITWLGISIRVHLSRSDENPVDIGDPQWGLYPIPSREDPNHPLQTLSKYPLQDLQYESAVPVGDYLVLRRDDLSPLYCTTSDFPLMKRDPTMEMAESDAAERSPGMSFTKRLQDRDRGCCITGRSIEEMGDDCGAFAAVHLFPRTHLDSWETDNLSAMIQDDGPSQGPSSIDSIQNGLLLSLTEAHLFSNGHITIDVDANYNLVDFTSSGIYQGRQLAMSNRFATMDARYRPLDDLLRFHYLQSVLANVRGPGKSPTTTASAAAATTPTTTGGHAVPKLGPVIRPKKNPLKVYGSPKPPPSGPLPSPTASTTGAPSSPLAPLTPTRTSSASSSSSSSVAAAAAAGVGIPGSKASSPRRIDPASTSPGFSRQQQYRHHPAPAAAAAAATNKASHSHPQAHLPPTPVHSASPQPSHTLIRSDKRRPEALFKKPLEKENQDSVSARPRPSTPPDTPSGRRGFDSPHRELKELTFGRVNTSRSPGTAAAAAGMG